MSVSRKASIESPPRMIFARHRSRLRHLRSLWLWAFVAVCIFLLARHGSRLWSSLPALEDWRVEMLGASMLLQVLVWLALGFSWIFLVRGMAGRNVRLAESLMQQSLVALGKYLPGKVWGMVARGGLLGRSGMAATSVVEVSLVEQILVLHSAAIVAIVAAAMLFYRTYPAAVVLAVSLSAASLFAGKRVILPVVHWLCRRMTPEGTLMPPGGRTHRQYLGLLGAYCLAWVLFGLLGATVAAMVLPALTLGMAELLWFILGAAVSMTLGFLVLVAPAGLGVRDVALGWILTGCLSPVDAALAVVAVRLWSVAADALLGLAPMVVRSRPV